MRHNKKFNHLSRTSAHRKAMFSNMAASLIIHKRITTTVAKAKALRSYVEPLITRSKTDTTHNRRVVFSSLQNKVAVAELFREVAIKVAERNGGYTRILKIGARSGDNAEMCIIELVDYNLNLLEAKEADTKKTRRSRRGGKKKDDTKSKLDKTTETTVEKEETDVEAIENTVEEVKETVAEETVAEEIVEVEEQPEAVTESKEEEKVEEKQEEVVEEKVEEAPDSEKKDETPESEKKVEEEKEKEEEKEEDKDKKE